MDEFVIGIEDPQASEVRALLEQHLTHARQQTPPDEVHALKVPGLLAEDISFFSIREDGALLGVGALKRLDELHAEIKSMHTAEAARGRGVGRAMVDYLVKLARTRGYSRVSLETGATPDYAAARALYASHGFEVCKPFAKFGPNSICMTLGLRQGG
jgi:putative acetyltransferase